MADLRLKFGRNPYTTDFTCAHCRRRFTGGGLYARLEYEGKLVDVPVCEACTGKYGLFEGDISLDRDNPSHSIGIA